MGSGQIKFKFLFRYLAAALFILLGAITILLFGMVLIGMLIDTDSVESSSFAIGIGCTLLGVYWVRCGMRRLELIKLYKDYAARFSTDPTHSLQTLAAGTDASIDVVHKNINKLMKKNFFVNAYIDASTDCLIFADMHRPNVAKAAPVPVADPSGPAVQYVTVACPGCGATNQIPAGTVGKCEFCESNFNG